MTAYHVERQDMPKVADILAAAGVATSHHVTIETADIVTLTGNYWDSGSRSYWRFVRLSDMAAIEAPTQNPLADASAHTVPLPPGIVCVEEHLFGQHRRIRLYAAPATMAPLLPAGTGDGPTPDEATVLLATAGLKPSYGGDGDFRFHEAHRRRGIGREAWDTAKAECIAAGWLNKAGAITPRGRNAIDGRPDRFAF